MAFPLMRRITRHPIQLWSRLRLGESVRRNIMFNPERPIEGCAPPHSDGKAGRLIREARNMSHCSGVRPNRIKRERL